MHSIVDGGATECSKKKKPIWVTVNSRGHTSVTSQGFPFHASRIARNLPFCLLSTATAPTTMTGRFRRFIFSHRRAQSPNPEIKLMNSGADLSAEGFKFKCIVPLRCIHTPSGAWRQGGRHCARVGSSMRALMAHMPRRSARRNGWRHAYSCLEQILKNQRLKTFALYLSHYVEDFEKCAPSQGCDVLHHHVRRLH
jgi:hypothetical protein